MAFCSVDDGYMELCEFRQGGVNNLWLINYNDIATEAFVDLGPNNVIDQIWLKTGAEIYYFQFAVDTCSLTQEEVISGSNRYVNQILQFTLVGITDCTPPAPYSNDRNGKAAFTQDLAKKLALGRYMAIIEDRHGFQLIVGANLDKFTSGVTYNYDMKGTYAVSTALTKNTGINAGEDNGMVVTLTATQNAFAPIFNNSVFIDSVNVGLGVNLSTGAYTNDGGTTFVALPTTAC